VREASRKNILVTGAAGFIGEAVVTALASQNGIAVTATDAKPRPTGFDGGVLYQEGDISDESLPSALCSEKFGAVIHLATLPSGAAEKDPSAAKRINLDATMALAERVSDQASPPRFVFASSIAVYTTHNVEAVDDETPVAPELLYGAHKAMAEVWLAALTRRGAIDAVSLRLPGIVARPRAPSGMTSAFWSDLFHALGSGERFVSPVSAQATTWLLSRSRTVENILHALEADSAAMPDNRALALPALRCEMAALVKAILNHAGQDEDLISYAPAAAVERIFGRYPPLITKKARSLGFRDDGDLKTLVRNVFTDIETQKAAS
jgi:nucleoside-diphosphate-sugar epimerase